MSNGGTLPTVDPGEWLARFIHFKSYIRQDRTIRPNAFIPHPHPNLSVTRHLQLSEWEIWEVARNVARQTNKPLYGRVDVQARVFQQQQLIVIADPVLPGNPNHANVTGWPEEKPAQKSIAQEIAAAANRVLEPPRNSA